MACYMYDMDPALTQIGDNVTVSYGCKFACHGKGQSHTPIVIENGAYIGMASLILSGKTGLSIGKGAIVGAGSVVTRSVPPHCVVAGNPARVIKDAKK
ncbi:MAG: acyltransferase [Syntrophomonadaceae bacterium]|nr:acyltransferase [Syntrophomonadaceae bacterium]